MPSMKQAVKALRQGQRTRKPSASCKLNSGRCYSSFDQLRAELTSRELPVLKDYLTPLPSRLLESTLSDFLSNFGTAIGAPTEDEVFPSHHLVYFPSPSPLSSLFPDGTDPQQSPGAPFTRRMWAGGSMSFLKPLTRNLSSTAYCLERISDVTAKGREGEEKLFVQIERRIGWPGKSTRISSRDSLQDHLDCRVIENRTLVFIRERSQRVASDATSSSPKTLKASQRPDFSHTLTPTPAMLFRFSALTFNAHAIHLDKHFCREIEGHRNLLVHGPLTLVLMVEALRRQLSRSVSQRHDTRTSSNTIQSLEYRNLAPLYAEEPLTICGRKKDHEQWEVWVEGKEGGLAVRGLVKIASPNPTV